MRKPREYLVTVEWLENDLPHEKGDKETVTIEATSLNNAKERTLDKYGDVVKVTNIRAKRSLWYGG